MSGFALDPRLRADCFELGKLGFCRLLLLDNAAVPWFILVPDREGITEIYQLSDADQAQLMRESTALSKALVDLFQPKKLNVAALGNMVPQLHVHHIVRYRGDAAWPAPVWGRAAPKPYSDEQLHATIDRIRTALGRDPGLGFVPAG